jgi:hypothetical protein
LVIGSRCSRSMAPAPGAVGGAIPDDDRAARHDDLRASGDFPPLVAGIVDVHMVGERAFPASIAGRRRRRRRKQGERSRRIRLGSAPTRERRSSPVCPRHPCRSCRPACSRIVTRYFGRR